MKNHTSCAVETIQIRPWEVLLYLNTMELSIATVINCCPSS